MAALSLSDARRVLTEVLGPLNAALAAIEAADDIDAKIEAAQRQLGELAVRVDQRTRDLQALDANYLEQRGSRLDGLKRQEAELERRVAELHGDLAKIQEARADEQRLRHEEAVAWKEKAEDARRAHEALVASLKDEVDHARVEGRADLDKLAFDRKEAETSLQTARAELHRLHTSIQSVATSLTRGG